MFVRGREKKKKKIWSTATGSSVERLPYCNESINWPIANKILTFNYRRLMKWTTKKKFMILFFKFYIYNIIHSFLWSCLSNFVLALWAIALWSDALWSHGVIVLHLQNIWAKISCWTETSAIRKSVGRRLQKYKTEASARWTETSRNQQYKTTVEWGH